MRPFSEILKTDPPLALAKEVVWRLRKKWQKKSILTSLNQPWVLTFRNIPYYRPDFIKMSDASQETLIAFANRICRGQFPFIGHGTFEPNQPPHWNVDFVSGLGWPQIPLENSDCMRFDGSDVKVPYELSRLQFLPVLGKAHVITGEEGYRKVAKELLSHWIGSNPFGVGVNWTLAMEVALRGMSVCFTLNLLYPFRDEEKPWLATVIRSLRQHFHYVEANIEFSHLLTSNHYLGDVVGLYCLAMCLDGEGMAAKRRHYQRLIETEIAKQTYTDGGDYEASAGYHMLVTQLFTTALLLMRADLDLPPSPAFVERLRRMFRFLNTLASPSGELPHVGDCDDGRTELLADDLQQMTLLPVAGRNSLKVSNFIGLGQRLFGDGSGPGDDAMWYGLTATDRTPYGKPSVNSNSAPTVRLLPKSGIAVLQHGTAQLLFFAMPNGISGKGSHTHNDKLSFILRVGGEEVFCDPGTGCYTRDVAMRNSFRRTAAHNTLSIDSTEQNRIFDGPLGVFALGNGASVSKIQAGKDERGHFVRAWHTGYQSFGVRHTRIIYMVEDESMFVVEDQLDGKGEHDFEFNLQLSPRRDAEIQTVEGVVSCRILRDWPVQLLIAGPAYLQGAIQPSQISTAYGLTVPGKRLCISGRAVFPTLITTRISWANAIQQHPDSARELETQPYATQGVDLS